MIIAALVVLQFLFARTERFFYVPLGNATQIDFIRLPVRLALLGIGLPAVALYLILRSTRSRCRRIGNRWLTPRSTRRHALAARRFRACGVRGLKVQRSWQPDPAARVNA